MKIGIQKPVAPTESEYKSTFFKNYVVMQYHFMQMFTEHLSDLSRVFESDLQSALILAIVGQRSLDAHIRANFLTEAKAPPEIVPPQVLGMNSSSIAEISGIPRETVRRKLRALIARGWIERDERGCYSIVFESEQAQARLDLAALERRNIERVSRFLANANQVAVRALDGASDTAPFEAPGREAFAFGG
jgi:hypothetical protein